MAGMEAGHDGFFVGSAKFHQGRVGGAAAGVKLAMT
jgi:hypothetical protein